MPLPLASLMLPSTPVSASASASADFGIHWRGLHARCLRFVATVTRMLLTTTQDSLPAGGPALAGWDSNPLGCKPGFVKCLASHGLLLDKACLAHHGHDESERAVLW